MITEEKKSRIEALVKELNEHNYKYYVLNKPQITDYQFDMMLKELESLEQETGYVLSYSPTVRIGSDLQNEFKDVTRQRIMGSIANCYDIDELKTWLSQFGETTFILEPKYDGLSCSLIYENGILVEASTRGSGYKGSDITNNVKTIKTVPLKLGGHPGQFYNFKEQIIPDWVEVRGEILLPKSELKRINEERYKSGQTLFANERNAAAGSIKQLDPKVTASRNLIFMPYAVYTKDAEIEKKYLSTQSSMLNFAEDLGFATPNYWISADAYTAVELLYGFEENFLYNQDYCMDGCVIKLNSKEKQDELGYTQKVPLWAKAFKFKQEQASSKLIGVNWQVGRTGKLNPVGRIEPVEVDGTVISNVTLNNIDYINELNIQIGAYILIERGGGVIPKTTGLDAERNLAEGIILED